MSNDSSSESTSSSEYSYDSYSYTSEDYESASSVSSVSEIIDPPPAPEALTENSARSYSTCHNARVELFFKAVRGLTGENLVRMLEASWAEDPLDTLRIIFQTRDCRGGKGERALFLEMMTWLCSKNIPNALVNIDLVPDYGRWLDLVQLTKNVQIADPIWMRLANQLRQDLENMMQGNPVTLCAKWLPTEGSKWDRETRASACLAKALGVNLKNYRKQYLTPLRSYLNIVERYMCDHKWGEIDYNKVPSVAMDRLKKAFARNDPERFAAWKKALAGGDPQVKVNAKVLFPHDLVRQYLSGHPLDEVIEAQWKVLVEETKKLGNFGRSLVISDVSGSMSGTPMEVSIALGIMISGCTAEPFRNKVITFSANPDFHDLPDASLYQQVDSLRRAAWQMNTDFIAVFKLILGKAKMFSVPPENMPNRLYVLSDMQFDQACAANYKTNYDTVVQMYQEAGYTVPEIVFWNLRGDTMDFPVGNAQQSGVAMVSGFTTSILRALLRGRDLNPVTVLWDVLDSDRYSRIKYVA